MKLQPKVFCQRGVISGVILLPLVGAVILSTPRIHQGTRLDVTADLVAWLLLGGGLIIRLWATAYIGGRKSHALVTGGPYAFCRHPLYVASFLIVLSLATFLHSLTLLAVVAVLVAVYIVVLVPSEERHAIECFGEAYRQYMAATPRFIPRWRWEDRPGIVEVKIGPFLRECSRAYGLIALGACVGLLAYWRSQPWWPTFFHLP